MKVRLEKIIVLLGVLATLGIIVAVSSCTSPKAETPATVPVTKLFTVTHTPFNHWHVLDRQSVEFKITETASGKGRAGLPVEILIAWAGYSGTSGNATQTLVRSVEDKGVIDAGDGIYILPDYQTLVFLPYAFQVRFMYEGQQFVSQPYVAEITKHGEEGMRVEANGTTYLYQVRNFWKPGIILASDNSTVTLSFELMRGTNEGADNINWKQPYLNFTEHITKVESAEVIVESMDGTIKDKLSLVYKGKGIYEAVRRFTVAEVGKGKDYYIRLIFTDPYNGARIDSNPYPLHAAAAK